MKLKAKEKFVIIIIAIYTFIFNGAAIYAAGKGGSKVAEFVTLGAGARPLALGGAYTAVTGDIFSVYYNPAGAADLKESNIAFMYNRLAQSISHSNITFGFPSKKKKHYYAASIIIGKYGDEPVTVYPEYNNGSAKTNENFDGSDLMLMLTYAFLNVDDVRFGFNFKYISQSIYNYNANALALDAGVIYKIFSFADIAAVIKNIGTRFKYTKTDEELPMQIRGGLTLKFIDDLLLNGELIYSKDEELDMVAAAEYKILKNFALRGAFNTVNDAGSGLTFGVGFNADNFAVDYAYEDYGDFSSAHKMSMNFKFGVDKKVKGKESLLKLKLFTDKKSKETIQEAVEDYIKDGYRNFQEGKYLNAMLSFKEAVQLDENNINARLWLAYSFVKLGDRIRAIQEYKKVLILDPSNINARQALKILGD